MSATPAITTDQHAPSRPSRLWLWVVAACLLQIVVWTAWIMLASKHPVAEVPLETSHQR